MVYSTDHFAFPSVRPSVFQFLCFVTLNNIASNQTTADDFFLHIIYSIWFASINTYMSLHNYCWNNWMGPNLGHVITPNWWSSPWHLWDLSAFSLALFPPSLLLECLWGVTRFLCRNAETFFIFSQIWDWIQILKAWWTLEFVLILISVMVIFS